MGAGEECLQAERTAHPVCPGRGHWLPAGLLPQRQAALRAGQLLKMPVGDCDPWFHLTPTCPSPACLNSFVKCLCVAPCLFLKCQDGFRHHNSLHKRLHLIPCSLHLPLYLCVTRHLFHNHTHTNMYHSLSGCSVSNPIQSTDV